MTRAPVDNAVPFDSRAKALVRKAVVGFGRRVGMRVENLEDDAQWVPRDPSVFTTDLQRKIVSTPGMISLRRAMYLYMLTYGQGIEGDVVELGSWQGRSTIAFAQACEDADNGVVHAVDWFEGNPGFEGNYGLDKAGAKGLEQGFRENIDKAGLEHRVVLHAKGTDEAAPEIAAQVERLRLMYIDADHTYEAVSRELAQYADMVVPGGLISFDDYGPMFGGVVEAIHEHLAAHPNRYAKPVQDRNFLMVRRRN
ncbi:class I SAM-dependent methyltransferase [Nocardioides humi]|uniref:class I SAM-dependent methyltransferase n=1 Tax=Nocardioides humi TaxID=449461 RepID=UPI0031D87D0A